ncbi:hypothetical protein [Pseudonocardia acaciae]|uniref:hypothetical protein n=1 Tax=Pseudonocardia acaciae TaxID=551276 RepID=UPI00048D0B29|nr:hypothetical protein [Pseudonocardia acaciae]
MNAHRLALVLATLPGLCPVCQGDNAVLASPVEAPERATRVPCPHCGPARRPLVLTHSATAHRLLVLEAP